jgi:hypothetical protein
LTQGVLGGEGRVVFSDRGIEDWAISRFKMDGVEIRKKDFRFSLQTGEGKFSLQGSEGTLAGGEFEFLKFGFQGKDWEGQWRWEKGALTPSHFNGWIDALDHRGARIQTGVKAQGSWERLAIECDLAGFLTGQLAASGGWEKDKWQFKIDQGEIEGVSFKGKGWIDQGGGFSLSVPEFSGSLGWLGKVWEGNFDGRIRSIGEGLELGWQEGLWDWSLQAKVEQAQFDSSLNGFSIGRLEQGSLELFTSPTEWSCYGIEGDWVRPEGKVHFFSPALIGKGDCWAFDFRCDSEISRSWDLFRFVGTAQGEKIVLDAAKSHLFGSSLKRAECAFDVKEGLKTLDLETVFPWSAILSAGPFLETYFKGWARPSLEAPLSGSAKVHFHYSKDGGSEGSIQGIDLLWKGDPLAADFHALELKKGKWKIDRFLLADINLNCSVQKGPEGYRIESGSGRWGRSTEALFEGTISPEFHSNLILKSAKVNLSEISSLTSLFGSSLSKIEGILEGEGHLSYEKIFEADFDFIPSHLKAGSLPLENRGPFHLYFSSEKGVFFQGLDLHVLKPDQELEWDLPWIDCKVGMLQYDSVRSHWVLNHSLIRLPSELFANLQKRPALFRLFDENEDLQFIADLDFASDFSNLACSMKEGWIPFGGAVRHLKDLQFQLNETDCKGTFKTEHNGHLLSLSFDVDMDAKIGGTLILEEVGAILEQGERPLKIDWEYAESSGGILHSIEGSFPGLDASFHSELSTGANTLIGTARIDFKTLSEFLPSKICEVFQELHMGKGYELKGRLKLENKQAFFQGLLYGKQYELFSYQFRTLLGQIDVSPDQVRIYDLKLSDSAGKMKIDEILMKEEKAGWTLSIPNLSIFELRPSLLQKPGQELGKLSPLLVRELKITDFKGMLDDSKTYTAKGHLHFINSFKREPTVFDLPADVLSRIVGLDLELLIPVSGSLEFELKDRFFRLMELKEAFSQSHRSEFFLEKGEDPQEPFMDLDGNLKILIKMKQFVLFKFTEAFLISIDGSLSDPQFHLQKKRRFFGL